MQGFWEKKKAPGASSRWHGGCKSVNKNLEYVAFSLLHHAARWDHHDNNGPIIKTKISLKER